MALERPKTCNKMERRGYPAAYFNTKVRQTAKKNTHSAHTNTRSITHPSTQIHAHTKRAVKCQNNKLSHVVQTEFSTIEDNITL